MNRRDKTLLQKLKDNAFFLAVGIGMLAILAVVAVYTMEQGKSQLASNDLDLNTASDFRDLTTEKRVVKETTGKTADKSKTAERNRIAEEYALADKTTQESTEAEMPASEETAGYALPTSAPAGELTFNSEETLTWPVNGEVILPYSMETTVYFETLDQYKCNPGMLIAAGNGSTVKSAYLGQVTKVTSDNRYGNMVTVYLGNNYSVVYGQLDTVYVKEGDYVKAGDSIGTIGNPTDSFAKEGSHLFFEMLDEDKPIDPMLYIE